MTMDLDLAARELTKADLFRPRLPEDDVTLDGVGTVRVRSLSRDEAMAVQAVKTLGHRERKMLAYGMVSPELTEEDVYKWQCAAPAGELEPVSTRIAELSGLMEESPKEAVKSFRGESGDGVRTLPSGEAVDDSGGSAGADG